MAAEKIIPNIMIKIVKYKIGFLVYSSGSCFLASLSVLCLQVAITLTA